jgi:hypothetical protein
MILDGTLIEVICTFVTALLVNLLSICADNLNTTIDYGQDVFEAVNTMDVIMLIL